MITPRQIIVAKYHLGKRSKLRAILRYLSKQPENKYHDALDIGIGTGGLASQYHKYAHRWTNIEPDREVAATAAKILPEKFCSSIEEVRGQKFDLITIIDTFFYFNNPDEEIKKLSGLLNSNGEILVTLTNGDNHLIMNRLRNLLGLGIEARGFAYEEPAAAVMKRFGGQGFQKTYYREFSYPAEEKILLFLDWMQAKLDGKEKGQADKMTNTKEISAFRVLLLKLSWAVFKVISLLDYPFRPFLAGHRFIVVLKKK